MAKHRTYKKSRGGQIIYREPSALEKISNTMTEYGTKAKNGVVSGASSVGDWFSNLTKPSTPPTQTFTTPLYSPTSTSTSTTSGGKRRQRHKTKKHRRGGSVVKSYNTYNDSFTANTTPVSGYRTAMPQNWVGGRRRKTRSRRVRGFL